MPKASVIKTSFTSGEFGPSLLGRTDISQYGNACKEVENWIPRPYGSIISTPGTTYVAEVKDSSKFTRLIPFVFNRADAFAIEMGQDYFRFYTDQASVVTTGTTPLEVAHVYQEDELLRVQYAQQNDIIYMAHPSHPPKRLIRESIYGWTFSTYDVLNGPFLDLNTTDITITPSATAGSITITLSATTSNIYFSPSTTTVGHVGAKWQIGASPSQGYCVITAITDSTTATATVIEELGGTAATTDWAEDAWSAVRGYPGSVTFHENRLFWARTDYEPQKVWGSKPFIYDDYEVGADDDHSLNLPLVSNESNEINWLASGTALAAGTFGGEFIIQSTGGGPLTPSDTTAQRATSWGSEEIVPAKIGSFFYYIQRFGRKLRELFYFWDLDTYKSIDKNILSPHILGNGAISMAFQQNPDTILWICRTDGTLATLTREVDQEVQAWARQVTDGNYEAVCSIPSEAGAYDEVWTIVNRTIDGSTVRYIELFDNLEVPDRQDLCNYLHSSLRYNAYDSTSSSATTLSLASLTGSSVVITASASYFNASDVQQRIRTIDADGVTLGEARILSVSSGTEVIAKITYAFDSLTYAAGLWAKSVENIAGLSHLEAETIGVLADGGIDLPAKTVSAGTISLAYDYFVVNCGMPYDQTLVLVPFEVGSSRGTSQGKIQKINEVSFKVNNSHKGFKVGGSTAMAEQINFRDPTTLMGTPEQLYTGIIPNITFNDDYRYGSVVHIINSDPLPVEILSVQAECTTYDK